MCPVCEEQLFFPTVQGGSTRKFHEIEVLKVRATRESYDYAFSLPDFTTALSVSSGSPRYTLLASSHCRPEPC